MVNINDIKDYLVINDNFNIYNNKLLDFSILDINKIIIVTYRHSYPGCKISMVESKFINTYDFDSFLLNRRKEKIIKILNKTNEERTILL